MNAWYGPAFDSVSLKPLADGMTPTGVWLNEWYRDDVYTIGLTAWRGTDGLVGVPPAPLPSAPPGRLEDLLHRLGASELFLPLRGFTAVRPLPAASRCVFQNMRSKLSPIRRSPSMPSTSSIRWSQQPVI